MDRVVIIGAGLGGVTAAKTLCSHGFSGSVTVLSEELHLPYDRPPLSKEVLLGTRDPTRLDLDTTAFQVDLQLGAEVSELTHAGGNQGEWIVRCVDGRVTRGDRIVIATGSHPRQLPALAVHPHSYGLRTLDDAEALRATLGRRINVVVIGAGWIGVEVASTATLLGCVVHLVEPEPVPLSGALGSDIGRHLLNWLHQASVRTYFGRLVAGAGANHVTLDDGSTVPADVVVGGIGVTPSTEWLASGPIELDAQGAIVVDEFLESVSSPGVYAIGDCASYPSRRYRRWLRPEHWANAQQSGAAAAANIMGHPTPYDPVPYFWSKQFGHMLQYVGHHDPHDELSWRGSPDDGTWTAYWLRHGRPTAFLAVNRPRDAVAARRLLGEDAEFDLDRLADITYSIDSAVRLPQ